MSAQRATSCVARDGTPLPLEGVQVQGRLCGRMLDVTLEQRYRNPGDGNVEVIYTFALPWRAVLLGNLLPGEVFAQQAQAWAWPALPTPGCPPDANRTIPATLRQPLPSALATITPDDWPSAMLLYADKTTAVSQAPLPTSA